MPAQLLEGNRQFQVGTQGVEATVALYVFEVGAQIFSAFAFDGIGICIDAFQPAVFVNPLGRYFFPYQGNSGQVIGFFAHQGRDFGVLPGPHPVFVLDGLGGHEAGFRDGAPGIQHADLVRDELERVAVPTGNQDLHAFGPGLSGQRGDDVVGFQVFLRQPSDFHGLEEALDVFGLTDELRWGFSAAPLVIGVDIGAETVPGEVKSRGDVGGLVFVNHGDEHREKPVYRIGVDSRGSDEVLGGAGIKGPKRQGVTVQNQ